MLFFGVAVKGGKACVVGTELPEHVSPSLILTGLVVAVVGAVPCLR